MSMQVRLAVFLTAVLTTGAFGQFDVPQLGEVDSQIDQPQSTISAEDIPPPEPIPANPHSSVLANQQPSNQANAETAFDGEINAYDFGVSAVPVGNHLRVSGVIVGSPAEAAGLKPNDTIVRVNDADVVNGQSLLGNVNSVSVLRDGRLQEFRVAGTTSTRGTETTRQRSQFESNSNATRYSVPRTTYSAPRSYYVPRPTTSGYSTSTYYRAVSPYANRGLSATIVRPQPSIAIGIGVGNIGVVPVGRGYGGYGRGYGRGFGPGFDRGFGPGFDRGFGPGFGYGPGFGRGASFGRGANFGRSGVGISIGGIGIRF